MKELDKLLSDKKSGSVAIAISFLNLIESCPSDIEKKIKLIKEAFPEMTLVKSVCHKIETAITEGTDLSLLKRSFLSSQDTLIEKAFSMLNRYDSFITISSSGDVYETLKRIAANKTIRVFISIGEPAKEGIFQAERLAKSGVKVTIVADAALAGFVKYADAVVMGADTVGKAGFINKIGSFPLLLASEYYKKPAYVIANKLKYSDNLPLSKKDSKKLGCDSENIHYENLYFEKIPLMAEWIHQ